MERDGKEMERKGKQFAFFQQFVFLINLLNAFFNKYFDLTDQQQYVFVCTMALGSISLVVIATRLYLLFR